MTLLFFISVEGPGLPSQTSPLLRLKKQYLQTESRIEVTEHCGEEGKGSYCLMGTEFLFRMMKIILEINSGDGCTTA